MRGPVRERSPSEDEIQLRHAHFATPAPASAPVPAEPAGPSAAAAAAAVAALAPAPVLAAAPPPAHCVPLLQRPYRGRGEDTADTTLVSLATLTRDIRARSRSSVAAQHSEFPRVSLLARELA